MGRQNVVRNDKVAKERVGSSRSSTCWKYQSAAKKPIGSKETQAAAAVCSKETYRLQQLVAKRSVSIEQKSLGDSHFFLILVTSQIGD